MFYMCRVFYSLGRILDMNILVTPNFYIHKNSNNRQNFSIQKHSNLPKYNNTLVKDTVSFTSKLPIENLGNTIENATLHSYLIKQPVLAKKAKHFHQAVKNVCDRLSKYGFSYDQDYNAKHPIKSVESYIDKYHRQGYVQDAIRGTVYWEKQHDINAFKLFLDEMEKEKYTIAPLKILNKETLKFDTIPDLEIRQNGINQEDLAPLDKLLQKAQITRPRSSTYSDFQMRFIPTGGSGKSEDKQVIELIMLYGPHYAKAKELESEYVYKIARSFDKLHIDLTSNYPEKSPGRRISNNIDVIKTRLREDVSRPLFTNAYNLDLKIKGEEKMPVVISKAHCKVLDGYMSGIRQKIPMYYREMKTKLKDDNYVINIIKNSSDYANRENKEISPQEIKIFREFIKNHLSTYEAEDLGTVTTAHELLKKTIKKFGEK